MKKLLTRTRPLGVTLAFAGVCALGAPAHAAEAESAEQASGEHGEAHETVHEEAHEEGGEEEVGKNIISVKLAGLEIIVPAEEEEGEGGEGGEEEGDRVLRRLGVAISLERVLIPGWLEAELTVLVAPGSGGLTLPIDLVVKKPFEFNEQWEAFVGLGLATEWFEAGERENAYGLGTQLGVNYWFDPAFALVVEGEYNLLVHPETAHEFVVATGGSFRF